MQVAVSPGDDVVAVQTSMGELMLVSVQQVGAASWRPLPKSLSLSVKQKQNKGVRKDKRDVVAKSSQQLFISPLLLVSVKHRGKDGKGFVQA